MTKYSLLPGQITGWISFCFTVREDAPDFVFLRGNL